MKYDDLKFSHLQNVLLKPYQDRANTVSGRFLRWFLEDIFRLSAQEADDASVDSQHDKGIDAVYVGEQTETIYLIQAKIRQKEQKALGDKDLKEFSGSLKQFENEDSIKGLLDGNASKELKNSINRTKLIDRLNNGFNIVGVFCTNVKGNQDARLYLDGVNNIELYDATRIIDEHIDVGSKGGIRKKFVFQITDTDVINYESKNGVNARIFLANASDLVKLNGISDGKLFEQNVRLSLGNTKINKNLTESIKNTNEHQNFPLYHNGITILCDKFESCLSG